MAEIPENGTLPPVYFAAGAEVFQNRRGLKAHAIATAINAAQAALICEALNTRRAGLAAVRWRETFQPKLLAEIAGMRTRFNEVAGRWLPDEVANALEGELFDKGPALTPRAVGGTDG